MMQLGLNQTNNRTIRISHLAAMLRRGGVLEGDTSSPDPQHEQAGIRVPETQEVIRWFCCLFGGEGS